MKMPTILFSTVALGLSMMASGPAAAETIEWKMQSLHPAGTPGFEIFRDYFVPKVEKMSGGRLVIKPFANDSIVKSKEGLDAVAAGTFEAAQLSPAYWTGKNAAFVFIRNASAGFDQGWQYDAWLRQGGGMEIAREVYATQGVHFVNVTLRPGESLHFKEPLRSLAEFRDAGPKVRTIEGIPADVFAAMGGSPVFISGSEVYSALDKGTIDVGEWTGLADNYSVGFHEVTDAFLYPSFHSPVGVDDVFVDQEAWDALPDDLKAVFDTAVADWSRYQWESMTVADVDALKAFKDAGDEHMIWAEQDMIDVRTMAKDAWAKWGGESDLARKVYESQIAFMKKIGLL
ncbi:MAG: TRAP transporter substrate-binding protein DctP [Arenicellales bacterium]|nr:TRAP transporter substrate-binding protein DctP [Arenicellales bacterium]